MKICDFCGLDLETSESCEGSMAGRSMARLEVTLCVPCSKPIVNGWEDKIADLKRSMTRMRMSIDLTDQAVTNNDDS